MKVEIFKIWETIRASFWFVPSIMAVAAFALSFAMIATDRAIGNEIPEALGWVYTGGPEGARAMLATIAGSMITVAGVAFSITIVALSLASSQFGPRLLSHSMRDTGNQVVLGTFTSTFLYCALILRTIRGGEGIGVFVPHVSVTVGLLLALASVGVLIYFIHHASVSIQVPHLIGQVAHELHHTIDHLFPEQIGRGAPEERLRRIDDEIPAAFERESRPVRAGENGYLQAIEERDLMKLATERNLLLRLERRPGSWVVEESPLVRVWPGGGVGEDLAEEIRDLFAIGNQRTASQDVEFSINQLVEVAVRALSPGINDPFTAINCIDQLAAGLCHLVERYTPSAYRFDEGGCLRVIAGDQVTFRGIVDAAFNQIRQNASYHASVRIRLLEAIATVMECAPDEDALACLLRHADMIRRGSERELPEAQDRADVEERYQAMIAALDRQRRTFGVPEVEQPI